MKAKCKANKLLAMLLSLVMLVGLLSTTALAADKTAVTEVNFTLSGYELGKKVVDVKPAISTNGVTWYSNYASYGEGAYLVAQGDDGEIRQGIVDDTATFAASTQYWLVVWFKADNGYDISTLTQEKIKLNGASAAEITILSGENEGVIAAFFKLDKLTGSTPSTPTVVDTVDFKLSGYELGEKVVDVKPVISTSGVTWNGENEYCGAYAVWQGEYENTPSLIPADSTATFAADTQYWLSVSCKVDDSYDISALTIENIKLNGVAAAGIGVNIKDGSIQADFKLNKLTESTPTEYTISFDVNGGNGTIASQTTSGHKLTSLPTAARSGSYSFVGWFTAASGGTEITPSYEFTADTTVYAHWTYTGSSGTGGGTTPKPTQPETPKLPFTDVSEDDWFYADAAYLYEKGVMKGTADETFAPSRSVTRGQLAAALYRMAGEPAVTAKAAFTDVPADYWCAAAITWAAENGVVTGYGDGGFRPADAVQRQELAAMLFRFAVYQGMSAVTLEENLAPFADRADVAAYAVPAMNWAVGQGILQGKDGGLLPQAPVDRAQLAAMLRRYLEK